jgi:hypothetical protein
LQGKEPPRTQIKYLQSLAQIVQSLEQGKEPPKTLTKYLQSLAQIIKKSSCTIAPLHTPKEKRYDTR